MPGVGDELDVALEHMLQGDDSGFRLVYRSVQPGLLRYLGVLVGNEAEDVASEAWAQAFRDLTKFRGDIDGFRGWITTIARNRALDHLRSSGRRPVSPIALEELPEPVVLGDASDGALESMSTDRAIALIAALPLEQAEAVLLRVVIGLDAKAAAGVLGKRPGAVRTAAHRGLRSLAEHLETTASNTFGPSDAEELR